MGEINLDEVRGAINTFARRTTCGRVFLPSDGAFPMKVESLVASAVRFGIAQNDGDLTVVDKTIHKDGDAPTEYVLKQDDILAVLDDSKIGLFSNIRKSPCSEGVMITAKGILTLAVCENAPWRSGFASWYTLAHGKTAIGGIEGGAYIFRPQTGKKGEYPAGPMIGVVVCRFKEKKLQQNIEILLTHLRRIAQGRGAEFDEYDVIGESAEESDVGESAVE